MRRSPLPVRSFSAAACTCLAVVLAAGLSLAAEPGGKKKTDHVKAYRLVQEKCTLCHVSVADPEKPGRTRDEWQVVVEVMHGYGLVQTPEETELIVDHLHQLRRGIERDPG